MLNGTDSYRSVRECFGSLTLDLLACEAALTSTPAHCRRVSQLDQHALIANSDAHSAYKLGRECTLFEGELSFLAFFEAIRSRSSSARLTGTEEYPVAFTRYWLSWCGDCRRSWDVPPFSPCPTCGHRVARGARDRIEQLVDRALPPQTISFTERLPLYQLIATLAGRLHSTPADGDFSERILRELGPERIVLNELPYETIARASFPRLGELIVAQRDQSIDFASLAASLDPVETSAPDVQLSLF